MRLPKLKWFLRPSKRVKQSTKLLIATVIAVALSILAGTNLKVEENVVSSLEESSAQEAAVFRSMISPTLLQNRLFLKWADSADFDMVKKIELQLQNAGYSKLDNQRGAASNSASSRQNSGSENTESGRNTPDSGVIFNSTAPLATLKLATSDESQKAIVEEAISMMALPGGTSFLEYLQSDPFLLAKRMNNSFKTESQEPSASAGKVTFWQRSGPLHFEKVELLYQELQKLGSKLNFVGADFFAFENYKAVSRDIVVCTLVSTLLSIAVFLALCRTWQLLLLLVLGTFASTAGGLLFVRLFSTEVSGLALAFTSTFVSFNSETLIHLSGLKGVPSRQAMIGAFSAIGTTLIGFLVFVFGAEGLPRQIGLISIGSLLGFVLFIGFFRTTLHTAKFRELNLPALSLTKWKFAIFVTMAIVCVALVPFPKVENQLEKFRFNTDFLLKNAEEMTHSAGGLALSDLYAVKSVGDPLETYRYHLNRGSVVREAFHPLRIFDEAQKDPSRSHWVSHKLPGALANLKASFQQRGLNISLPGTNSFIPSDARGFLTQWNATTPVRWIAEVNSQTYITLPLNSSTVPGAVSIYPKRFYEMMLDGVAGRLLILFGLGLVLMFVYLIPWQRSGSRLLYIVTPLLIATIALQIAFWCTGRTLNIAHVMALSLIIGVALDYSTVLVSHNFSNREQGKVFLTGAMTLTSFGSLLLAQHPVLRELGFVVCVGTASALLCALGIRIKRPDHSSTTNVFKKNSLLLLTFLLIFQIGCQSNQKNSSDYSSNYRAQKCVFNDGLYGCRSYEFPAVFFAQQSVKVTRSDGQVLSFVAQVDKKRDRFRLVLLDPVWNTLLFRTDVVDGKLANIQKSFILSQISDANLRQMTKMIVGVYQNTQLNFGDSSTTAHAKSLCDSLPLRRGQVCLKSFFRQEGPTRVTKLESPKISDDGASAKESNPLPGPHTAHDSAPQPGAQPAAADRASCNFPGLIEIELKSPQSRIAVETQSLECTGHNI